MIQYSVILYFNNEMSVPAHSDAYPHMCSSLRTQLRTLPFWCYVPANLIRPAKSLKNSLLVCSGAK